MTFIYSTSRRVQADQEDGVIKVMKKYLFIVLLVGFICGQNNNAYAEFGGAGYTMTFNYERMLTENIIARVGSVSYTHLTLPTILLV